MGEYVEDVWGKQRRMVRSLSEVDELRALRQLVVDFDDVVRLRGDKFGAMDCRDNEGGFYPSAWGAELVRGARDSLAGCPRCGSDEVAGPGGLCDACTVKAVSR